MLQVKRTFLKPPHSKDFTLWQEEGFAASKKWLSFIYINGSTICSGFVYSIIKKVVISILRLTLSSHKEPATWSLLDCGNYLSAQLNKTVKYTNTFYNDNSEITCTRTERKKASKGLTYLKVLNIQSEWHIAIFWEWHAAFKARFYYNNFRKFLE